jgi:hypothetical protein
VRQRQTSGLTFGIILVLVGLGLLAREFHMDWSVDFGRLWPVVFFAIAAGHLANTERRLHLARATWFIFLGTIFLLHTFHVASLRATWPLFIVAGGVSLLMEQLASHFGRRDGTDDGPHGRDLK